MKASEPPDGWPALPWQSLRRTAFNTAWGMTHHLDDSTEIALEAIAKLLVTVEKDGAPRNARAYIRKITKRLVYDRSRKRGRRPTVRLVEATHEGPALEPSPHGDLSIVPGFDHLSGREQEVLRGLYLYDQELRVVAAYLGISVETAKEYRTRALRKLRLIANKPDPPDEPNAGKA